MTSAKQGSHKAMSTYDVLVQLVAMRGHFKKYVFGQKANNEPSPKSNDHT